MHTLAREFDYGSLVVRLATISPHDAARWGRMNVYQMLCHVACAISVPLGETQATPLHSLRWRTLKWPALWYPKPWPPNVPTHPEIDQCALGIIMGDFTAARLRAQRQLGRLHSAYVAGARHPLFGKLNQKEWMRWGWLHTDHHLRQFGR
jgi:hypothetical protein